MAMVQEREAPIEVTRDGAPGASELLHGEVTGEVIAAFYAVYNELGHGFLDAVYVRAMAIELFARRMGVSREVPVSVFYKGVTVGTYRADLVVSDTVVVAIRAGAECGEPERMQLLNYLRSSGKEVGLLLHFGPKAVLRRVVSSRCRAGSAEPVDE